DLAAQHLFTLEDIEVPPLRNQLLVLLGLLVRDDEPALALGLLTEADRARELRENRGVLRPARLEEIGHARQTARDVASLRAFLRQTSEHVADDDPRTVLHAEHGA